MRTLTTTMRVPVIFLFILVLSSAFGAEDDQVEDFTTEEPKQDEAQDRFVDLSVDVSYGLPELGYVYNGLHLRGPRRGRARNGFSNYVEHPNLLPLKGGFQPNFNFESGYNAVKDEVHSSLEDVQPNYDNFVTKPPVPQSEYAQLQPDYNEDPEAFQEEPVAFVGSPYDQYTQPPYAPPSSDYAYSAPTTTKPPLHIKIQQDLKGLVGSMTNMFKSHSKQGSGSGFQFKMPEILPQAEGKPPLMEKIRQDFLSWLPGSSTKAKSSTAQEVYAQQPSYPEPIYAQPDPEPVYAQPQVAQKQPRKPLLNKYIEDFHKANTWLAKQTLDLMGGSTSQDPTQKIRRRLDSVMKYLPSPDLSKKD